MGKNQERIALITDTGCFMDPVEARIKGIYLLPLQIIVGEESFDDLVDINTEEIYKSLREGKDLKTSLPKYQVMYDMLTKIKNEGFTHVISVPLTSGISSTSSVLQSISAELELPMTVIDCFTTCQLQKDIVNHALQLIKDKYSVEQIVNIINKRINHSGTFILSRDIQHLKKGGRLTPLAATVASMAKIFPILTMNQDTNGHIDVFSKVRTDRKAKRVLCEEIIKRAGDDDQIYILHSDDFATVKEIKENLMIYGLKEENITIEYLNSVVGVHVGLKCIAIQYIKKETIKNGNN